MTFYLIIYFNHRLKKIFIIQITEFSRDPMVFNLPNGETISISDASIVNAERDIFGLNNDKIMQDSYKQFYDKILINHGDLYEKKDISFYFNGFCSTWNWFL
jgi:hypothetical protein